LVASGADDQAAVDEETPADSTTAVPEKKPGVQVDEQLTKALDILKAKAA
jgi:hypothetical protein